MTERVGVLPTSVVGSYPQPDWLIDRSESRFRKAPRVRLHDVWRIPGEHLQAAHDDATILAIRDMERAGVDIVTDGEVRRESYSNYFASALDGIDIDEPGEVIGRTGVPIVVPRVVGKIGRPGPIGVRDAAFLRANTDRTTKVTVPGPFTMAQQVQDDFYGDDEALAMDYAVAVNQELLDLKKTGVDAVQIDEPWLQARPERAARYGVRAINRALEGVPGPTVVHVCFGYAHLVRDKPSGYSVMGELASSVADQISIEAAQPGLDPNLLAELSGKSVVLGVISLAQPEPETAGEVADRIRAALAHVPAERLIPAPDCGMKYLDRAVAFAKLRALAEGAAIVRRELAG